MIVALTPCLSNDPHYGASDSSLKGLIYEYAGTAAPQASTHQPLGPPLPLSAPTYVHTCAGAFTHMLYSAPESKWHMKTYGNFGFRIAINDV